MQIVFTLCSNNYLAQASLLVESFLKYNSDYSFYIGLVDDLNEHIKYPHHKDLHVLPCNEVVDAKLLKDMSRRYKIVELNTSLKPFYISYFLNKYADCKVMYFDPDIYIYHSVDNISELLNHNDFVITPHCLSPIALDNKMPQERSFMKYGLYNLGFIAMRNTDNTKKFIEWWKERLTTLCYSETEVGVYVDQSWINFLPVFFGNTHVSLHPGYNAAFWNLHERYYENKNGNYFVNDEYPLVFFHFSSFRISKWETFASYQTRFNANNRPDAALLFKEYANVFKKAKQVYSANVECVYTTRTLMDKIFYYTNSYTLPKKLSL